MATYKEFEEALKADEGLMARFTKLAKEYDPKDEEEAIEAKCAVAAKLGFDVPASEFKLAQLATQELDDEQLDMVAGGDNPNCLGSYQHCSEIEWCFVDWDCKITFKHEGKTCSQTYECVTSEVL